MKAAEKLRERENAMRRKMTYAQVQQLAKQTLSYAAHIIAPGLALPDLRKMCEAEMLRQGADSFWYWGIGALCFAGDETAISVSGRKYRTSDRAIQADDIITIDLSPQCKKIWGDYARTIVVEQGRVVDKIEEIANEEWRAGLRMEEELHREMRRFVTADTTFEELYGHMNRYIDLNGFVNLDFMGNLGHSIVTSKARRVYIEAGNRMRLSEVPLFTFEPHIGIAGSKYGYKREDIYYFKDGVLNQL